MESSAAFEEFTAAFYHLASHFAPNGLTRAVEDDTSLSRVFDVLLRTKQQTPQPTRPIISLEQSGGFLTSRDNASSGKYAELVALLNRPHMKALFTAFDEVARLKSAMNDGDTKSETDEISCVRPAHECVVLLSDGRIDCEQLISLALTELGQGYARILPDTSRPQRAGESDGTPYNFLSREAMLAGIENGLYMESGKYNGNLYGTSLLTIENAIAQGTVPVVWPRSRPGAEKLRSRGVRTFTIHVKHTQYACEEAHQTEEINAEIAYENPMQATRALVELLRAKCFP